LTRRLSAPRLIALGFAVFMVLGTLLLKLPASTYDDISWVDALFVSVSAVSVTGLTSVPFPGTFTTFGIVVVMLLVQVGGLGVMTFATLGAVLIGQRVGFRNLLTVRQELGSTDSPRNVFRLIGQIAGITLLVEAAGAVVLAAGFIGSGFGYGQGLFQAVFHAIAAFCNAGFVALPEGDLTSYAGVSSVNLTLVALIVLGGLGFPVLVNLYHYRQMRRLTLHSKLVLITSATLVLLSAANPLRLGCGSLSFKG
jgi:trk system potassium uptake protein